MQRACIECLLRGLWRDWRDDLSEWHGELFDEVYLNSCRRNGRRRHQHIVLIGAEGTGCGRTPRESGWGMDRRCSSGLRYRVGVGSTVSLLFLYMGYLAGVS